MSKLYKIVESREDGMLFDALDPATLQDLRAAAKELGFAVVPVEPTEAMLAAYYDNYASDEYTGATSQYKAMLAAAEESDR